jgi:hypothetical protein
MQFSVKRKRENFAQIRKVFAQADNWHIFCSGSNASVIESFSSKKINVKDA